jgi:hypothetical protein
LHPDIQKSLAKSEHPEIHAANFLHNNPHFEINDENANKLVNHKYSSVRRKVAQLPEYAGKLVNDGHPDVRSIVAQHPEHAGKLVNDRVTYVKTLARKTLEKNDKLG